MHWTTHILVGAACGITVGRPVPAALCGIAGHMLMDALPHYDPQEDLSYVVDSAIGLAALCAIASSRRLRETGLRAAAVAGAVGAGLPDVELLRKLFVYVEEDDYIFPTHNGRIEHRETGLRESNVLQGTLVVLSLTVAAGATAWRLRERGVTGAPSE